MPVSGRPCTTASCMSMGAFADIRVVANESSPARYMRQPDFNRAQGESPVCLEKAKAFLIAVRSNPTEDADINDFNCGFSTMRCGRPSRAALTMICSGTALRYWALVCSGTGDSRVNKKRVPIAIPSAPRLNAATRPAPLRKPPAAASGTATASRTCGSKMDVATCPVCPPPSLPCTTSASAPSSTAFTACFKAPTVGIHTMPAALKRAMVAASGERL